tara:strand:- start:2425 stop:2592 length:168 start_codon:yes stop_codon:yes gene_type:complete
MKNILGILFLVVFLASCGGGGSAAAASSGSGATGTGGNAPLGSFAGQVDPVQATD